MDDRTQDQLREHYEIERELAGRLRNAQTAHERRSLYGKVYQERSERISHHPLVQQAAAPAARARAVAPQARLIATFVTTASVFLEIGAGDGAVTRAVAPLVRSAIAVDVADSLALPDEENFQFRTFDGFELGMPAGSVDVVYSNDVVEHLHPDDMLDQARAVRNVLRSGGTYLCVTPNRLSGPHDISGQLGADHPEGFHLREYTATELSRELRRAGFTRTKVLLTYRGRRLSPFLPLAAITPVEWLVERLPQRVRRRLGPLLAAIKVVATA